MYSIFHTQSPSPVSTNTSLTMAFQLLDPREEDELHKSRLLNVEEKPFKRITKRLLTPGSLLVTPSALLTPPPDTTSSEAAASDALRQKQLAERRQFREDVLFDFEAFDSSIKRIQFLRNSNERERERYAADKERILETAQAVRDNTVLLRTQLEESKKTLEQRKKFDVLAEKITNSRLLRPREEQEINLQKLEEECRELERESTAYGETWKERREQFGRIVEEGMQLRRLIRDEKEEVERREGMDGGEEDGEVGEGQTPRGGSVGGNTPAPESQNVEAGLKPRPLHTGSLSRAGSRSRAGNWAGSRATSRAASPAMSEQQNDDSAMEGLETKVAEGDVVADTPMAEVAESQQEAETPQVTIEDASGDATGAEQSEVEDKMDTT